MSLSQSAIDDLLGRDLSHTCDNPDCVEKRPLKEAKLALYTRLAAEAVDVERWVGGNQSTGHAEAFKALPLSKLKAIMEIKE